MNRVSQLLTVGSTFLWLSGVAFAAPHPATPPGHAQYADHDGGNATAADSDHSAIPEGAQCSPASRGEQIAEWLHNGSPFNGGPGSYGNIFMSANVSRLGMPPKTSPTASVAQVTTGPSVEVGPPSPPSNPPAPPSYAPAPPAGRGPSVTVPVVTTPGVTAPVTTLPAVNAPTLPPAANLVLAPGANAPVQSAAITAPVPGAAVTNTTPTRFVQPSAVTPLVNTPSPSPTPEPGTLFLLTTGAIGLAAARRRRNQSKND